MSLYDYVIVGSGPTGLTLAYGLSKAGKKCIIVDRQPVIGGCHRVLRVNGLFTEHSPRVYLSSYRNTFTLLEHMGISPSDIFTPYRYGIGYIMDKTLNTLSWYECACLSWQFMRFLINPDFAKNMSVHEFASNYDFSKESKDYLDRLCRLSDGAGSDRTSLSKFLQLPNQNIFYSLYQPKVPNDIGLFPRMQHVLENNGVSFLLNASVTELLMNDSRSKMIGVSVEQGIDTVSILGEHVILAVPPSDLTKLLNRPSPYAQAFGDLSNLVKQSNYNVYVAAIFHWNQVIELPKRWGFPSSDWGLISIPLSEYTAFADVNSKTVISTCISYLDRKSSFIKLSANQVDDSNVLLQEIFRQLKETYPDLPPPTFQCLSPTVYRDQGKWVEEDSGYIHSTTSSYIPSHGTISNLYQVGTQNGASPLQFTTFESAVSNALSFLNEHETPLFPLRRPFEVRDIFFYIIIAVIIGLIIYAIYYWWKNKSNSVNLDTKPIISEKQPVNIVPDTFLGVSIRSKGDNYNPEAEPISITYQHNQDTYSQNSYNQDNYNQDNYNQDTYNQDTYNQETYSQDTYNQDTYNQDTYNQETYSQDTYNQDTYNQDAYNKDTSN
jgi:hypothetical protein